VLSPSTLEIPEDGSSWTKAAVSFIGERYLAHARQDVALKEAERIRAAVSRLAPAGSPVRLLSTT